MGVGLDLKWCNGQELIKTSLMSRMGGQEFDTCPQERECTCSVQGRLPLSIAGRVPDDFLIYSRACGFSGRSFRELYLTSTFCTSHGLDLENLLVPGSSICVELGLLH